MGQVFSWIFIIALVYCIWRHRRNKKAVKKTVTQVSNYIPQCPSAKPLTPWTSRTVMTEVVGESFHDSSFAWLWSMMSEVGDGSREKYCKAWLSDDSANPYDRNAVAIWVEGLHVGYLDRLSAAQYSPIVKSLGETGTCLEVKARVWARNRNDGKFSARVSVWLPPVGSAILPENGMPDDAHVVLPIGSKIAVTKESEHMDVLRKFARAGDPVSVAASLHVIKEVRPRSVIDAVEVRINGERVGILSPVMSDKLLPLVQYVEARGMIPIARAEVTGSQLAAEVVLFVVRADEVDDAWLKSLGPTKPREVLFAESLPHVDEEPMWDDDDVVSLERVA